MLGTPMPMVAESAGELAPRVRYLFHFPLALAATSVVLWIAPTDSTMLLGSVVGTLVAGCLLWDWICGDPAIRLSAITTLGLLLGYCSGTLNSWLTAPRGDYVLAAITNVSEEVLARGLAAAMLACAVLLAGGELLERPVIAPGSRIEFGRGIKRIVAVATVILMGAAAAGKFAQGGFVVIGTGSTHRAGAVGFILSFLMLPSLILATAAFLVERGRRDKLLLGAAVAILWLLDCTQGRRNLIYPAIASMAVARTAGYNWRRISLRRVLSAAFAVTFLTAGVLGYMLLRIAGWSKPNSLLPERIATASEWVMEGKAFETAELATRDNVRERTLVLTFLADLFDATGEYRPGYGADLINQLKGLVPTAMGKGHLPQEEELASRLFNRNYPDLANSVLTAGAVDFGLGGMLVYPLAVVLCLSCFLRVAKGVFTEEMNLYALVCAYTVCIAAEGNLVDYLMMIRNLAMFGIVLNVIVQIPRMRIGAEHPAAGELP